MPTKHCAVPTGHRDNESKDLMSYTLYSIPYFGSVVLLKISGRARSVSVNRAGGFLKTHRLKNKNRTRCPTFDLEGYKQKVLVKLEILKQPKAK